MNKTAIKNFAIWARNKLIADVSYDARLIGITEDGIAKPLPQSFGGTQFFDIGTAEPYSISGEAVRQRDKLIEVIQQKEKDTDYKTAYQYVIEEVAYTWFNRLIAIRFMEVNDYLPSHIRVLSSESGKLEPDLVTTPFDAELPFTAEEEAQIFQLKQDNKLDEVFRILFLKQCNALNEILPALFEKTKNYTELLLSLSVIDQDGVVYHLLHDIPEDDFNIERGGQVEIIGWLYQYYNTEPKAAAFAKNGKITKEEIPAVTQLFTPDWIVRYMVENSLGRLWVEGHPDCGLKENWKYYLEEAQQEPEVQVKLAEIRKEYAALNPEDIKLIDPCMGSGHILVYAFDVLMQIYESAGYSQRDAAKSILENNIYGLDIDDRAYQLAYFAVMMKARQYNRRILNGENTCHVYAIQESNSINRAHLKYFGAGMDDIEKNAAKMQLEGLLDTLTDAKEYGSILNVESYNWDLLRRFVAAEDTDGQISMDSVGVEDTAEQLNRLIDIGETMARKYWVTVTNPPYRGISDVDVKLQNFAKEKYPNSKADLSTICMERAFAMTCHNGMIAMINIPVWMFIATYEKLRLSMMMAQTYINMLHCGRGIFGSDFGTTAFIISNTRIANYKGTYHKLFKKQGGVDPIEQKEKWFFERKGKYIVAQENFDNISGAPLAYWINQDIYWLFRESSLGKYYLSGGRFKTCNDELYLKFWWEMDSTSKRWHPYCKGGDGRKYFGNMIRVIDWCKSAQIFYSKNGGVGNRRFWDSEGITWSTISTSVISFRKKEDSYFNSSSAPTIFAIDKVLNPSVLAYLNSKAAAYLLNMFNPTASLTVADVLKLPFSVEWDTLKIRELSNNNLSACQDDWDSFEISTNFLEHPCSGGFSNIESAYNYWEKRTIDRYELVKENEKLLNEYFSNKFGLQEELSNEPDETDITVRKADLQRDVKSLLSYAVGCMFGRYSLDVKGLAYAGGAWNSSNYKTFIPDADNVIPITDEEYLDNDIVSRLCEWLRVVYGVDSLECNLDFIAEALGNKGETSREIIRNYFLNDFFNDHKRIYQRCPIYWLFDSGKQNGFKALVYLHRYTPDTIGNLRIDYLHKMQRVYESEINRMQDMMDHSENAREVAAASKRKDKLAKQLKECREYDEKISHLALSRIELDLDDGVKVNYRKLQTAQDGKFYEVLADSKNIMVKEKK